MKSCFCFLGRGFWQETARPGPKKKEQKTTAMRRADSGSALGLAAAISKLTLSPAQKKQEAAKQGKQSTSASAKRAGRPKQTPPEAEQKKSEEAEEDLGSPEEPENEVQDVDADMNQQEKDENAEASESKAPGKKNGAGKLARSHAPKAKAKAKGKAKAKAKALCKADGVEQNDAKKRKCMDSCLGKAWLAFRDEELASLAASDPDMKYHAKLKIIADRRLRTCVREFLESTTGAVLESAPCTLTANLRAPKTPPRSLRNPWSRQTARWKAHPARIEAARGLSATELKRRRWG